MNSMNTPCFLGWNDHPLGVFGVESLPVAKPVLRVQGADCFDVSALEEPPPELSSLQVETGWQGELEGADNLQLGNP